MNKQNIGATAVHTGMHTATAQLTDKQKGVKAIENYQEQKGHFITKIADYRKRKRCYHDNASLKPQCTISLNRQPPKL